MQVAVVLIQPVGRMHLNFTLNVAIREWAEDASAPPTQPLTRNSWSPILLYQLSLTKR